MNHLRNKEIVLDQIKTINKDLETELGMIVTKKVWELINTLIIKVNQYSEINKDINTEKLDRVYADTNNNAIKHIRKDKTNE